MPSDSVRVLERDLRAIFGARLQSLIVYGLHEPGREQAPVRTMALVETLTEQDLRACAGRVSAWHQTRVATPLFMPARDFARSLDAFPLEFAAIIADHEIVVGPGPFASARVDPIDVRRACEVQARSHLLHLREAFVEAAGNSDAVAILIVKSAAPLAALLQSVARLEGRTDHDSAAAARHAEHTLGVAGGTFADIVRLAAVQEIPAAEAERLFPRYLAGVERLVDYVDGWAQKRAEG